MFSRLTNHIYKILFIVLFLCIILVYYKTTTIFSPTPKCPTIREDSAQSDSPQSQTACPSLRQILNDSIVMAKTTTTPAFYFASRGQGVVSQCVIQYGSFAPIETILFKTILKDRCVMQNGSRELVIDIGGNLGYFSIYAALHGCRVKTYEPVPGPYWYIELNVGLNNVIGLVETHRNAIGSERGFLKMNEHPDWGLSMINMNGNLEVEVITIDDIIKENIILMKVDIEGYESYALKALEDVMKKFTIENIILEMKRVNEDWGRALVNRLVEKEGYLVMSYQEEYGTPNHNKNLDQINCINMHGLNAGQWIPYEDLWIVKKDSVTYNRVSSILKCHN